MGQAADGAQLRLGKYQHKPEQEWSFVRVGDNAYRIHCRANNKVVDLVAAGTGRGTWLHLWDDVMGSSQVWVLTRNNDGTVQISSPWASGKCVDTVGMGSPEGAILQIWDKTPGDDQHWLIAPVRERKGTAKAEEAEKTQTAAVEAAPAEQAQPAGAQPAEHRLPRRSRLKRSRSRTGCGGEGRRTGCCGKAQAPCLPHQESGGGSGCRGRKGRDCR